MPLDNWDERLFKGCCWVPLTRSTRSVLQPCKGNATLFQPPAQPLADGVAGGDDLRWEGCLWVCVCVSVRVLGGHHPPKQKLPESQVAPLETWNYVCSRLAQRPANPREAVAHPLLIGSKVKGFRSHAMTIVLADMPCLHGCQQEYANPARGKEHQDTVTVSWQAPQARNISKICRRNLIQYSCVHPTQAAFCGHSHRRQHPTTKRERSRFCKTRA